MMETENENYKLVKFVRDNKSFLNNPLIKNFLSEKDNNQLFKKAICYPFLQNREALDQAFKEFYFSIRFTAYISSTLYFHGINIDKKIRQYKSRFPLHFENSINESTGYYSKDYMQYYENFDISPEDILEHINDFTLYETIKNLNSNQKEILQLAYIKGLTDSEIGLLLEKSQQAVSKSHRKALLTIKDNLKK